jgi:hypothetical protein
MAGTEAMHGGRVSPGKVDSAAAAIPARSVAQEPPAQMCKFAPTRLHLIGGAATARTRTIRTPPQAVRPTTGSKLLDPHGRKACRYEPESRRRRGRHVDNPPLYKRPAVDDRNHRRAAVHQVRHPHLRPEGKGSMRSDHSAFMWKYVIGSYTLFFRDSGVRKNGDTHNRNWILLHLQHLISVDGSRALSQPGMVKK